MIDAVEPRREQIGHRFTPADLERDLQVGAMRELEQAQELIRPRALRLELRLDRDDAVAIADLS
jgi:hypothetical protein